MKRDNKPSSQGIQILCLKEKHGDCYYVFDSDEQQRKIMVDILKHRLNKGWYDHDYKDEEEEFRLCLAEAFDPSISLRKLRSIFNMRQDYKYEGFKVEFAFQDHE